MKDVEMLVMLLGVMCVEFDDVWYVVMFVVDECGGRVCVDVFVGVLGGVFEERCVMEDVVMLICLSDGMIVVNEKVNVGYDVMFCVDVIVIVSLEDEE